MVNKPVVSRPKPPVITKPKTKPVNIARPVKAPPAPVPVAGNTVRITSNPPGATVLLNFANKGETPVNITLNNDNNTILVRLEGYEKFEKKVSINEKQKVLHVDLVKIAVKEPPKKLEPAPKPTPPSEVIKPVPPPAPKPIVKAEEPKPDPEPPAVVGGEPGSIFIASRPQGAEIFLNGKNLNLKTPTWVRDIPPGKYDIKLVKGIESITQSIEVKPGRNKAEFLVLK